MLIKCPECGNQISNKAEICPHCGIKIAGTAIAGGDSPAKPQSPQKKGNSHATLIVSFLIALAVCGTLFYYYQDSKNRQEREAYEYAIQSDDPVVLRNYLNLYMDAPREHRDSINSRLNFLQGEDTEWENVLANGSRGALLKYIDENPGGPYIAKAKNMVDSIDYSKSMRDYKRDNDIAPLEKYVKEHPDGHYASEILGIIEDVKSLQVTPENIAFARDICKKFFQAINARNESKLLATVTDILGSFLNRSGATSSDVVSFMNKLYKEDITNMNWHILDDFKVEKVPNADGGKNYAVHFGVEQRIERTDADKETYGRYIVIAEITPEGKITKFNMKKLTVQE